MVVIEEEAFEIDEAGEIRNGSGERVVLQAEDAELVETRQGVGSENTTEI